MTSVKKSRATFVGVVIAFLIPVLGAYLVLQGNWYQGAATNKGTMLVPPFELGELNTQLPEGWRIVLRDNGQCNEACIQGLYAINQLDVALGKETDRVTPVFISAEPTTVDLEQMPIVQNIVSPEILAAMASLPEEQLFIVDPMGNAMLYYPTHADEQAMRLEAKNLLSDLRTLLKLSKIG
ncbi:hypothetical protein C9928_01230 [Pseudidiomarina aestuarii]|uniref:Cytochrome oxidase n=1 Tax=Pseudidiomarina aestuarii TaxID=624146 RepID=A0A6N4DJ05_9GAMM|nr:hypothetical protein C9928_01230 [Pseudidiomarina aestuarii]